MRRFFLGLMCSVLLSSNGAHADEERGRLPHYVIGSLVTDEKMALALAETLIREKYGEDALKQNQPMTIRRDGEFWLIEGRKIKPMPLITTVKISSIDARVDTLQVSTYSEIFVPMTMPDMQGCDPECHGAPEKK